MYTLLLRLVLLLSCVGVFTPFAKAQDPIIEAVKEASRKIIKAVDLQVQRWQNNTIDLQNIQKEIENILSKLKLEEIADWTNKQKELYQQYFDELWRVKTLLTYYRQFSAIVNKQKQLFAEYKRAYGIVQEDSRFTAKEKEYMIGVYDNILSASIQNIDDLLTLMQSFSFQMSDADRLKMISETNDSMDEHLSALRQFNQSNQLLSTQRAKSQKEIESIQQLYGIQ